MRVSRRLLLAALIVIVVTVGAVPLLNIAVYTPAQTVRSYIAAIARGDAEHAFSYLSGPAPTGTLALRNDVLAASPDLPRDAQTTTVSVDGDRAKVGLHYALGSHPQDTTLDLVRLPSASGLFSRWAIVQDSWPTLDLRISGSSSATINGYSIRADTVPVLFPATYLVGSDGTYLRSPSKRAQVTGPGDSPTVSLAPEPTQELEHTIADEVDSHLQKCMKAKTLLPSGCVFGYETDNEIIGDVKWSLERPPAVSLTAKGNDLELTPVTTEVRITGRYRDIVTAAVHDLDERLSFVLGGSVVVSGHEVHFEPRRLGDMTVL